MYDIIGDIHGHADELVTLLERLGYDRRSGVYARPDRKVIFVGDFIDRGPQIREVLELVRPMVEAGSALTVMGNHELNALCYHCRHPDRPGGFLREHSDKNVSQYLQTLLQLRPHELADALAWFRTLPLWLERDGMRVVHACWDARHIERLRQVVPENAPLNDELLQEVMHSNGTGTADVIEDILKGKELHLPDGVSYRDKDGHERRAMRVKWYLPTANHTYRSYAMTADPNIPELLPESVASSDGGYRDAEPPVFIGHYWLRADCPSVLASNVACVDYSVARGGHLCAYRWDGERELSNDKFVFVKANC